MRFGSLLIENMKISLQSIRSNLLRTILTILIIAVGITALVGILTAIEAIKKSITEEFTFMGVNTFTITSRGMRVQIGDNRYRTKNHAYINYYQAKEFKERYNFPGMVSISVNATGTATVKYESKKSNPNITVVGVDENYLNTSGYEIDQGRNLSESDISDGLNVVVIGEGIVKRLFENGINPIQKEISIGNGRYRIIGTLKPKAAGFGNSGNEICMIPYSNVRTYFSRPRMNFNVQVKVNSPQLMDAAIGQAEGTFRIVRGLNPSDESDFNIEKSDNLANMLLNNIQKISMVATIIGLITLFGAAIGLMNIMLVSVTERTREIGVRKAIGATSALVRQQFLIESIIIGQLGGALGIILGILIGNIVSSLLEIHFIIPWLWILLGTALCFGVSILSGYYPAQKAARFDPIESLRYE